MPLIRWNWWMLHLTFMFLICVNYKWSILTCEGQWEGSVSNEVRGARSPAGCGGGEAWPLPLSLKHWDAFNPGDSSSHNFPSRPQMTKGVYILYGLYNYFPNTSHLYKCWIVFYSSFTEAQTFIYSSRFLPFFGLSPCAWVSVFLLL